MEAAQRIETVTGLRRSQPQVRTFLNKLGLKRRKVGQIPAKADLEEQKTFLAEELEPRLAAAKANKGMFSFWMRLILSCNLSWAFSGVLSVSSSRLQMVGNASMSWGLYTPPLYNW